MRWARKSSFPTGRFPASLRSAPANPQVAPKGRAPPSQPRPAATLGRRYSAFPRLLPYLRVYDTWPIESGETINHRNSGAKGLEEDQAGSRPQGNTRPLLAKRV